MIKTKFVVLLVNLISLLVEMKLDNLFQELIIELRKSNYDANFLFSNDYGGTLNPDNGRKILLSKKAVTLIDTYSGVLYANFSKKDKVDFQAFDRIVYQEFANCITSDDFRIENIKENIKICVEKKFEDIENAKITYHFPATTFVSKFKNSINIGCIYIRSTEQWLKKVDFSPDLFAWYEKNASDKSWKLEVIAGLKKELDVDKMSDVAKTVYRIIKNNNSMVSVEISGYEKKLSEKFARQICKSGLDMISLTLGDQSAFYNNILQLERLPVMNYGEFTENNGHLNLPSSGISKLFVPIFDEKQYAYAYDLINQMLEPYSFIINGLVHPSTVPCPNLVSKWVFALNWYAEGMRESNDAIAVAKLASCLDTLSSSGKLAGIKQVLRNVYECEDDYILFGEKELNPVTIHTFVKRFYDDGRSRVLHGTLESMLESFEVDRNRLAITARRVLLVLANRLSVYKGEDNEKAFRTMKSDE